MLVSSDETIGAFNTGFDACNLHRPAKKEGSAEISVARHVSHPTSPSHIRNFVETAPTLRSYGQFAQGSGAFDLPIRKLSYEQFVLGAIRVGIGTGRLRDLAIRKWEPVSTKFRRFVGLPTHIERERASAWSVS